MINTSEILQTVRMITEEKLDIRTITMGISLYECVHPDKKILYQNVYDRITTQARDLVKTGETLEREFGIPIVNKRISVTPASLVAAACGDPVVVARAMDAAAKETGVNYIGGYTALVQKGMTAVRPRADRVPAGGAFHHGARLLRRSTSLPPARASTWTRFACADRR